MGDRQLRMVFILILGAVILAVASFVAMSMISRRPDPVVTINGDFDEFVQPGAGPSQLFVDGIFVLTDPDPRKQFWLRGEQPPLIIVPEAAPPAEPTPMVIVVEPATPTPEIIVPPVIVAPVTSGVDGVMFIDYVVQPGDTLYGIASRQNSSIELMALHNIAADTLVVGRTLRLPVANPAFCPGRRPYIVRDKDTVFRIAAQFNTTAPTLRDINGLAPNYRIDVTQVICVP